MRGEPSEPHERLSSWQPPYREATESREGVTIYRNGHGTSVSRSYLFIRPQIDDIRVGASSAAT